MLNKLFSIGFNWCGKSISSKLLIKVISRAMNENKRKSMPGISSRKLANLCLENNRRINVTILHISAGKKA